MAITVHIYYTGVGYSALQFAKEMLASGVVAEIRAQSGNLQYEYFQCLEDEQTILLVDSWENQDAIDEHHHSERMLKIMELREKYQLKMRVERLISDEQGVPEKDRQFIVE